MKDFRYFLTKCRYVLFGRKQEIVNNFFRRQGVTIGKRCLIYSNILTSDSYLIEIKDDVVISTYVRFVTHDYSVKKVIPDKANLFGKITIGSNCFIGEGSILMYGIELSNNIIVAAGSVVTHSFLENNIIIGGNPAKKIGDWESFQKKSLNQALNVRNCRELVKEHPEFLVKR